MNIKALGLKIAHLRELAGYSQDSLALKTGVARNAISSLEKGRGNPTVKTLEALSKALGVPLIELFEGGPMPVAILHAKAKRNRESTQMLGAKGTRATASAAGPSPEDLHAGLDFVSKFANQERDIQLAAMALVYGDVRYLSQLSAAFRAQLVQLLSVVQK